jgi:hypothetical protein
MGHSIIWLEDPKQWRYLRALSIERGSRRGFKKDAKLPLADFYKLVGYELLGRGDGLACFIYRIYWLKTYDSGCPRGSEVYDKGGSPCEAVTVTELLDEH